MKKHTLRILLVLIVVLLPIAVLMISYLHRLDKFSGDFIRSFPYKFSNVKGIDLKYNSFYIVGKENDQLLLGNYTTLPRLFAMDSTLTFADTILIDADTKALRKRNIYKIALDSPYFYLLYSTEPAIFKGAMSTWSAEKFNIPAPYFADCIPINGTSAIFKYTNRNTKHLAFRKVFSSGDTIENGNILEVQVDGQFCTSGHLKYNRFLNVLIYVYAYRNQVLVMDTNLNFLKKFNTIDHIDTARFKVSEIKATGSKVVTSPTILVNQRCAVYKQYLFVNSKIRGKKEDDTAFEHSTVLDIYNINTGKYVHSLSLPNVKKANISQLEIIDGFVYTISGTSMNRYKFELPN